MLEQHAKNAENNAVEETDHTLEACEFLAKHYASLEDTAATRKYVARLMNCGGPQRETAKLLLREMEGLGSARTGRALSPRRAMFVLDESLDASAADADAAATDTSAMSTESGF